MFLSHFCVAFTRVTPVSNFSMPYYLQHCPQDTPLVMLYTERADMPPLYTELAKAVPPPLQFSQQCTNPLE